MNHLQILTHDFQALGLVKNLNCDYTTRESNDVIMFKIIFHRYFDTWYKWLEFKKEELQEHKKQIASAIIRCDGKNYLTAEIECSEHWDTLCENQD